MLMRDCAAVGVDRGDGQAVDVVAAAGEQPDDARQDAGLVVHQHGDGALRCVAVGSDHLVGSGDRHLARRVMRRGPDDVGAGGSDQDHALFGDTGRLASCSGPSSISLCAAPDGIIGKQFSVWSTAMSAITARVDGQHLA